MRKSIEAKYGVETSSAASTTTTTGGSGKEGKGEIKMCVAEEGREMSDYSGEEGESEDEVMI